MLYFEDIAVGQQFHSPKYTIKKDESIEFAKQFDPQYFHTDEKAAKNSHFERLVVSGWHTAAISMRLKTETEFATLAGGLVGLGMDKVRWLMPVYPDDTLEITITIIEKRRSSSKPTHGIIQYMIETKNQHGDVVLTMNIAVWTPLKQP